MNFNLLKNKIYYSIIVMKIFNMLSFLFSSLSLTLAAPTAPTALNTCNCNNPYMMDIYQPTCGKNGITYSNRCSAICHGHTSVDHFGSCIPKKSETGFSCYDKIDNDKDGLTDCEDPDCANTISYCKHGKNAHRCNYKNQAAIIKQIKLSCCGTTTCENLPNVCSSACAKVFIPYYRKCGHRYLRGHRDHIYKRNSKGHTNRHINRHINRHTKGHINRHINRHTNNRRGMQTISSHCKDTWKNTCPNLVKEGYCKKGTLVSLLKQKCPKSCGFCRKTPIPTNLQRMAMRCYPVYREEFANHKKYTNTNIPTTCTLWNDGCNNCGVNNGKLTFCTRMMCIRKGRPHCVKYKGIAVISAKPIAKCNEIALVNVLKGCENTLLNDMKKISKNICSSPCVRKMVRFYNKCYNAPSLQNFFKNIDLKMIKPCEEGIHFIRPAIPLGGRRDSHNCVTSAGYTWCGPLKKCVRRWKTPC